MRLESGNIYGNGRGSYMLVFNTTKFGATFTYCNTDNYVQEVYANIPELKIDNTVGTVCIDRIIYVPWTKMNTAKYELYKKLSRRQYILIVNALSALYLGDITIGDTVFEYIDKVPYKEPVITTTKESITPQQPLSIQINSSNTTSVEDKTASIIIEQKSNSTDFEIPNSELIRNAEALGIPVYNGDDMKHSGEKFFDLLPTPTIPAKDRKKSNGTSAYRAPAKERRHLFSETECISIACSSIAMISEKYDVSKSDASQMLKNAKKLFGDKESTPKSKPEITVKEIYESGMSLQDAIFKYRNIPTERIRSYYQDRELDKDDRAAIEKWDSIITHSDTINMRIIIKAARSDVNEFHLAERCSMATAENILGKINKILAFNPFYVVFGDRAYEEDLEHTFANGRACSKNIIDSYIYTITELLSEPYKASYNNHYDILHGIKPVPEAVSDEDREFFMSMLYNHYNPRMILGRSRHLSGSQRKALESYDTERVARAFAVQTSRARSLINSFKNRQKREGGK